MAFRLIVNDPLAQSGAPSVFPPASDGPPLYQRTPRKHVVFPQNEVEVQAPPPAPSAPTTTIVSLLLPLSGIALSVLISIVLVVAVRATGGLSLLGLVLSVPMMLASVGAGLYNYKRERKKYKEETTTRDKTYRDYLAERRQALDGLRQAQLRASLTPNPDLAECQRRAERRDSDKRLWERAPGDVDFLSLRLGTGRMPVSFAIKPPEQPKGGGAPDMLLKEALDLAAAYAYVDGAAITLPLPEVGSVSLAGDVASRQDVLGALLMQLATHHAPTEVKLVLVFPEAEMEAWAWARWLPHVWNDERTRRFMAATPDAARQLISSLYDVLKQRRLQRSDDKSGTTAVFSPVFVFVFADPALFSGSDAANLGPFLHLLTEGAGVGAHALFLHESPEQARKECGAVVDLTRGDGRLRIVGPPPLEFTFTPDRANATLAQRFARTLAPLRLETMGSVANLPQVVPLLDLFGVSRVEDLPVQRNWQESKPFESLAVPLGRRAGNDLVYLDLHERGHGPHGLVAGTTRSGKSELLQSLVLSLAIQFSPEYVAFVFLDFKGGATAYPLRGLPHVLNVITELEMDTVPRALVSLEAELARREHLFNEAGVQNIDEYIQRYRQRKVTEPLPYLVLIVDEFTVLKDQRPDDMRRFVMVAVKGGSLGFRMILATQKPHGVISDQIDANSRFRLCLRVARPEDSTDMIRRPDAASLTGPGRTFFRVGEDEIFELFQTAWSGAAYAPEGETKQDPYSIAEVLLDGRRCSLQPTAEAMQTRSVGKQIDAVIQHLRYLVEQQGIKNLPRMIWKPPLPLYIPLEQIRPAEGWDGKGWQGSRTWLAPVIGLLDDPAHQLQAPLRLDLGKDGHLAVYGAPGTGKTTLLQTLVTSLALSHSPQEVNLYVLDFGGRILRLLEPLPHVGGVILSNEIERMQRLVWLLQRELDGRKNLLLQAGVTTLAAYRDQTSSAPPAIVVIVDNYPEFARNYPDLADALAALTREGGNFGLHFVFTASAVSAIPSRVSSNMALAVALELHETGDYGQVVGRTGGLLPTRGARGRGLVRATPPLEFQTALPAAGSAEGERSTAMKHLFSAMRAAWQGPSAPPVPMVPDVVPLCDILQPGDTWSVAATLAAPVGLDVEMLEPCVLDLTDGPHFLITGPPVSGKTTLLQSWVLALVERLSPQRLELYLVDMDGTNLLPFSNLQHVKKHVEDDDGLGSALDALRLKLEERRQKLDIARRQAGGVPIKPDAVMAQYPALVLAVDDFDRLSLQARDEHKNSLEYLLCQRGLGFYTLVASPIGEFSSTWDSLRNKIKGAQTGVLLGTTDHNDLSLFNLRLPPGEYGKPLPLGVGYFARRGRYRAIKCATPHEGTVTLADWVARIQSRASL